MTAGLSDAQVRSIHRATRRINIWEGAVRSGKSVGADFSWFNFVRNAPASGELVMMGRTKDTVGRNVINVMRDPAIFGRLAKSVSYTDGANSATVLGRQVHILGANDVTSETKIRGMTVCGAYVDEATILPEVTFKQLVARMSVAGARLFATTNPDSPNHWFKRDWIDRVDPDIASFHFTIDDNPFLPADYVAYLKRQYTGLWYRRFILGLWVIAEGAVYDSFDLTKHTVDPSEVPFITHWTFLGIDYGTTNPFHAILGGIGLDKRLYAVAEWRHDSRKEHRQMTDIEYSAALRDWLPMVPIPGTQLTGPTPRYVVIDPSAASFRLQFYRDGISSWPANNSVLDRIRTVSAMISGDQVRFSRACPELIGEMAGYSWDHAAQLKGEDKPLKQNDHGPDAWGYGTLTTESVWRSLVRQPA